jgi:hypothetical protein
MHGLPHAALSVGAVADPLCSLVVLGRFVETACGGYARAEDWLFTFLSVDFLWCLQLAPPVTYDSALHV